MCLYRRDDGFNNGLSPILNITDRTKGACSWLAFNFIVSPRRGARALFLLRPLDVLFFSPAPSCSPAVSRSLLFSLPHFSRFSRFSLLPFRRLCRFRSPIFSLAFSLFHFSIAEGKIIYLSVAFLLPPLPSSTYCRAQLRVGATLLCKRRRRPLGSFSLVSRERCTSRASQTLPENYAAVASRCIYFPLRDVRTIRGA